MHSGPLPLTAWCDHHPVEPTHRRVECGMSIEPREDIVEVQEEAETRVKRVVVFLRLERRRAQVGRDDVQMEVPCARTVR